MKFVRILALVALALIAVGIAGFLVTATTIGEPSFAERVWRLDGAPVRRIELNVSAAGVSLIPTHQDTIEVRLSGRSTGEQAQVAVVGDTLRIHLARRPLFAFFGGRRTLAVTLPERTYSSLQAEIRNGNLEAGRLTIGDVHVRQGNGKTRLEGVRAERLDLLTGNGNIRLQTRTLPADATLDLSTSNGSVRVFGANRGTAWRQMLGAGDPYIKMTTRNGNIVITD